MFSVKVDDYGETEDNMHFVTYMISGLSEAELDYLIANLEGELALEDGNLFLNIFYSKQFFPFGSDDAHFKLEDFIKREEIEMTYFIASFLEDMK